VQPGPIFLNLAPPWFIQIPLSDIRHFVHQPRGDLRPFVREILWVQSGDPRVQTLLPETTLTLVLRRSGAASINNEPLPSAVVSGLQQHARIVEHGAQSSVIVIRFTEVGAPAILHDRVDLLYSKTAPLDSFIPPRDIERIQSLLADHPQIEQQIPLIEQFLLDRLHLDRLRPGRISAQLEAAAKLIRESGGTMAITSVARRVAMSQSALERQLRAAAGAAPKMLSRLARLQRVCRLWDAGKSLTTIAFEAGYTDQPHMVRDFQLFTGTSPQQFFRISAPRNLPTFYK
jgi:AraC-like DNA-binding protein